MSVKNDGMVHDAAELRQMWYQMGFYGDRAFPRVLEESCSRGASATVSFVGRPGEPAVTATVGEVHAAARRVATALQDRGIGVGDKVAVQLPNRVEATIAYEAVLLTGAVLVPIVHIYGRSEVCFILEQSGARLLVQPARWSFIDYGERVAGYLELDTLDEVVVVGDQIPDNASPWDDLASVTDRYSTPDVHPDEVAMLIYTSGTTSAPKGVQHSHNSLLAELQSAPRYIGTGEDAVQLVSFPPGHIAGVASTLRPLIQGQDAVYMDAWDPSLAVELIARHRVTATAGTPFHLSGMLEQGDVAGHLSTLREFLIGAATVPEDLVRRAADMGISTYRCYGSTEHPTVTSGSASDPDAARLGTDGTPIPGATVRIIEPLGDGTGIGVDVPVGTDGEVVTRGPDQFIGYQDSSLDADAFTTDGWMRTGDLGRLDENGRLTITDRLKDVVIRAGETISSAQVEDVLLAHPAVAEGAVVAAPDPRYGEVAAAVVVTAPGRDLDLDQIRAHFARSGLAKQKTPERLVLVDVLPRTAVGKVRKADIRAEHFFPRAGGR